MAATFVCLEIAPALVWKFKLWCVSTAPQFAWVLTFECESTAGRLACVLTLLCLARLAAFVWTDVPAVLACMAGVLLCAVHAACFPRVAAPLL